jgi:hypothetical protein
MSMQEPRRAAKTRRRVAPTAGNSLVHDAPADADVIRMATAEAQARAAQRQEQIATAAYFRAQQRGFEAGHELDDWLAAEAEIATLQVSIIRPDESSGSGSAS